MIIAITGTIGSGKSLVSAILAKLANAVICDTDVLCRELLEKDNPGWQGVVQKWGDRYLNDDGSINKPLLREAIFENELTRKDLEDILHPHVRSRVQARISQARKDQNWLLVEIPLLFETGWQEDFDCVITVFANQTVSLERVVQRDGVSPEQVIKTIASQMDIEMKKKLADYVIDNSEAQEKTARQVEALFAALQENKTLKKTEKISRKNT